jgi:hypothetical protein
VLRPGIIEGVHSRQGSYPPASIRAVKMVELSKSGIPASRWPETTTQMEGKGMNNRQLPLIHVHGSHHQMGCQIGEACRGQVQHSIENAHVLLADAYEQLQLSWEGATIQARKYIPFAEERYPQYIEELKGIAQGANVSFDDVAIINAMEAVTMDALHLAKCTSMAVNQ